MAYSLHDKRIGEKRRILRAEYGGMMTIEDLARELGYKSRKPAIIWTHEVGLEGTRIGHQKRFDTDIVAKILVDSYGI
jgi:ribosomal protein L15E